MVNLRESFLEHEGRSFFTAYASGAEHRDLAVFRRIKVFAHKCDKVRESLCAGSGGPGEGPQISLVSIPSVQDQYFVFSDQRIPFLGPHIFSGLRRIYLRFTEGDDFRLDQKLQALERR